MKKKTVKDIINHWDNVKDGFRKDEDFELPVKDYDNLIKALKHCKGVLTLFAEGEDGGHPYAAEELKRLGYRREFGMKGVWS